jgi:hypothetical protein
MPFFAIVLAALLLLLLCSFFPGFLMVRRLNWTPLEKLCGSVGLSMILVYAAAWGIYCFGPQQQRTAYWAVAGAAALTAAITARDSWRLFRSFRIRQTLLAFAFLLAWSLTMLAMIRVYSGAAWAADWAEHFQRSLFFLNRLPHTTEFIELYVLPARPPMQNVLAAFFLGLTADRFEIFQTIFGFQNMLMFLPCVLLMPALGFRKRRALLPLVALFAANPVVMQNVTYTWTKALAAFYIILAISLYLSGWRKNDRTRTAAAFLSLAAGVLVHYSAGPYVVVMGLHYLYRVWRDRPRRWLELPIAVVPAALLLASWFGWSMRTYGSKVTFASNTSITSAESDPGRNLAKIGANVFDTIVPAWMRDASPEWPQPNQDGKLRDQAFVFYQLNVIFGLGVVGGPIALWLLYRGLIRGKPGRERLFWRILVPAAVALGVAVVGERDPLGVSHLTLLALEVAGLALLASAFPRLHPAIRVALVAGCVVDFGLGVFLHARIESLENSPTRAVFPEMGYQTGQFAMTPPSMNTLSENAWRNWLMKHRTEVFAKWLAELPRGHENDPMFRANWPQFEMQLKTGLQLDETGWGGWRGRNGGKLEYLGDRVAGPSGRGTDVATGVFLVLFAGCMWLLGREAISKAPRPVEVKLAMKGATPAKGRR